MFSTIPLIPKFPAFHALGGIGFSAATHRLPFFSQLLLARLGINRQSRCFLFFGRELFPHGGDAGFQRFSLALPLAPPAVRLLLTSQRFFPLASFLRKPHRTR